MEIDSFNELLSEDHHKEVISSIEKVALAVSESKNNEITEIKDLVSSTIKVVDVFLKKVEEISSIKIPAFPEFPLFPEIPAFPEVNLTPISKEISDMNEVLNDNISKVNDNLIKLQSGKKEYELINLLYDLKNELKKKKTYRHTVERDENGVMKTITTTTL
jgi:hypothetical protein